MTRPPAWRTGRRALLCAALGLTVSLVGSGPGSAAQGAATLALLPLENVSGHIDGQRLITPVLGQALAARGYQVVEPDRLDDFLARHRIRDTGRLSRSHLTMLRDELGAQLAMVGAVAIFNDSADNPQWGLVARVLATDSGEILWASSAGLTGDDFTVALGLGTITSAERLARETVTSLLRDLAPGGQTVAMPGARRWLPRWLGPRATYRSATLDTRPPRRVAVLPFENTSERSGAARIVSDVFTAGLVRDGRFAIVEPGTVSEALLAIGVFPYGFIDFETLAALRRRLLVDAVILGTVYAYSEGIKRGATTSPDIAFDARMLDAESGRILWAAESVRTGDDSKIAFHFGTIRAMMPLVVRATADMLETL